jgi:hypothetical protein
VLPLRENSVSVGLCWDQHRRVRDRVVVEHRYEIVFDGALKTPDALTAQTREPVPWSSACVSVGWSGCYRKSWS